MTEQKEVVRLDYSKPPPGMWVDEAVWNGEGQEPDRGPFSFGESFEDGWLWFDDFETALAAAWAHLRRHNDPPGMRVVGTGDRDQAFDGVRQFYLSSLDERENAARRASARNAAWTWHDRRLAALSSAPHAARWWPLALTWSDEQVAEVERWLVDSTAEMPEVLRG